LKRMKYLGLGHSLQLRGTHASEQENRIEWNT